MQVMVPKARRRGRRAAYVVFEGLAPGIYDVWYVVRCSLAQVF